MLAEITVAFGLDAATHQDQVNAELLAFLKS